MAQISFFKPQALVYPLQGPLRGHGTGEGSGSPGAPYMFSRGPSPGQLLDSVLGLGALGLTTWVILSTACPALLLLLLLVSFLAFDLLHR